MPDEKCVRAVVDDSAPKDDADDVPLARAMVMLVVVDDGCGRNFCRSIADEEPRRGISMPPANASPWPWPWPGTVKGPEPLGATPAEPGTLLGNALPPPPRIDAELDRGYGYALRCLDDGDAAGPPAPGVAAAASLDDNSDVRDFEIDEPLLATLGVALKLLLLLPLGPEPAGPMYDGSPTTGGDAVGD